MSKILNKAHSSVLDPYANIAYRFSA